jgi:hypothetical protein
MTARAARRIEHEEGIGLVRQGRAAWIELEHPRRLVLRASPEVSIEHGAHEASGLEAAARFTSELEILHAPLRAASLLPLKAQFGRRVMERGLRGDQSWHLVRWAELAEQGGLEAEWKANSYENGQLDVYGKHQPVVEDLRLREIVRAWVRPPAKQAAARMLRRSY